MRRGVPVLLGVILIVAIGVAGYVIKGLSEPLEMPEPTGASESSPERPLQTPAAPRFREPVRGWAAPLPLQAFEDGIRTCSRPGPSGITGYWQVSEAEVSEIDQALLKFLSGPAMRRTLSSPLEMYMRQYMGLLRGSRRYVYINAFPKDFQTSSTAEVVDLCDGGPSFWGIEYDLASRRFGHREANGVLPPPPR